MKKETQLHDQAQKPGENSARRMLATLASYDLEVIAWFFDNAVKPTGIQSWLKDYEGDDGYEELREEIFSISSRIETLPGKQLLADLRNALAADMPPIEWVAADDIYSEDRPHFPSGVPAIDEALSGKGFYGVTTIGGAPKVGKSLMALGCAIEAARAPKPWKVIYCNAEMDRGHITQRAQNYMGKIDRQVVENLKIANVTTGISRDNLIEELGRTRDEGNAYIDYSDDRLLIVLDSINRIVDMGIDNDSDSGYWRLFRDWSAWAMNTRKETEGKISWLIVSELASHGGTKGQRLEYLADTVITVNKTGTDDIVEVDVPYSRATQPGYVGALRRDFGTGRFVKGH